MSGYWEEGKTKDELEEQEYALAEESIETKVDSLFHIGSDFDDIEPAETIYCKRCGGNQFHVGKSSYWTGIKCITCKWERCVHNG